MGMWRSISGVIEIELTSADIAGFLSAAAEEGIDLQNVLLLDGLSLRATISTDHYRRCQKITDRRGEKLRIVNKKGIFWYFLQATRRPVLWLGLAALLVSVLYIPGHIYFIRVEGNKELSDKFILQEAERVGICFGARRSDVRSEKVKNALLLQMPQLQWLGVNTKGCIATIQVSEKTSVKKTEENKAPVCSIVAVREGIIRQIDAVKGNVLCKPGQVVKGGQTLISGYTDCGLSIQATQAEGEVFAETSHDLSLLTITNSLERREITGTATRYSLQIGKKLIKLYNDSGISDASCAKIYVKKALTLPGNYALPVALIKEELVTQRLSEAPVDNAESWLPAFAREYVGSHMIAGRVLKDNLQMFHMPGVLLLEGRFTCHEMIGRLKNEEIIVPDGENE